jgi:hypothetical protein
VPLEIAERLRIDATLEVGSVEDVDIRAASDTGGTAVMGQSVQSIGSDVAPLTLDVELAAGDWVSVLVR